MVCVKKRVFTIEQVFSELSLVDRLLPIFIFLAMLLGVLLSVYVPSSRNAFDGAKVVGVSVPLAVGLIVMMIPPLCKVEWEHFFKFFSLSTYLRPILWSLLLNWIICPFLMFGLAWLTLFDKEEYRRGIIMIGLARCIAMVLIWNEISEGDNSLCAVIVLINSLLQIILYAPYQIFFCYVITGDYTTEVRSMVGAGVSYDLVARSVAFFLGIPLAFGLLIRMVSLRIIGKDKFQSKIVPIISPWALIGLLYTIIVIFIEKGDDFIKDIGSAIRCFVPFIIYFFISWFGTFFFMRWVLGRKNNYKRVIHSPDVTEKSQLYCGCEKENALKDGKWVSGCSANYGEVITQSFTASSNNFELSIAIAIAIYGSGSKESIAATFGPLLEVPILLALCFVAKIFKIKFMWLDTEMIEEENNIVEETE